MAGKRHWGRIRPLPSGRYQARYPGPDGVLWPAPETFARKGDAENWLTDKQAEIRRDGWIDPQAGNVKLREYATTWVEERKLSRRTRVLYRGLLKNHICPFLGDLGLVDVTTARLRTWRKTLLDSGVGAVVVAKAYRLLSTVFSTAVEQDQLIRRNPCRIPGAGQEYSPERPIATVDQVFALADAVPRRYRLLLLLACFTTFRWSELAGLARRHVNLEAETIRMERTLSEMEDGSMVFGPPKSKAGDRLLTIPDELLPDVVAHLDEFVAADPDSLLFLGPKGGYPRRSGFQKHWVQACKTVGVKGLRVHDLRHTGSTLAAENGAGMRDLMDRMGHSTTRAARIYMHKSAGRDKVIADRMSDVIRRSRRQPTGTEAASS